MAQTGAQSYPQKFHFECREVKIQQHQQSFVSLLIRVLLRSLNFSQKLLEIIEKHTQTHSKVQKCEFSIKTNENIPKNS